MSQGFAAHKHSQMPYLISDPQRITTLLSNRSLDGRADLVSLAAASIQNNST